MRQLCALAVTLSILVWLVAPASGQNVRHEVQFPELPGCETLVCDLHMHSVFSDGDVWPTVRVDEAFRLGFDALALTDHIEYKPHKDDISAAMNRSYLLAAEEARMAGLLFPRGAEITRDTPPGHFNALFLKDIDPLNTDDFVEQIKRANGQGAFVFWNHQGWKGAEAGRWLDVHTQIYEKKWLHGMEVCNGDDYYPEAHQWCLEKGLTMMGDSDIHEPDLRTQGEPGDHRTVTLVFVKERTLEGLKEALFAGRTAVWWKDQIIGRKEILEPFFKACLRIAPPHYRAKDMVLVQIANTSDVDLKLQRTGPVGPAQLTLPARSTTRVRIGTATPEQAMTLAYTATNFLIAPTTGLPVSFEIAGK